MWFGSVSRSRIHEHVEKKWPGIEQLLYYRSYSHPQNQDEIKTRIKHTESIRRTLNNTKIRIRIMAALVWYVSCTHPQELTWCNVCAKQGGSVEGQPSLAESFEKLCDQVWNGMLIIFPLLRVIQYHVHRWSKCCHTCSHDAAGRRGEWISMPNWGKTLALCVKSSINVVITCLCACLPHRHCWNSQRED